jgi:anaphase-promoting complex subunit 4
LLAVACSDGVLRLVGAESSKNVHQIATAAQGAEGITCLGWVSNITGKKSVPRIELKDDLSWKDLLEGSLDEHEGQAPLNLPRELSLIDIESSMPKLSPLPAGGTSYGA